MTECERLIVNGLFSKDFFNEEIRCGYKVTVERKKMWALQIDLYMEFARVCEKFGLRYFAMFGTALGAVRHKGFIPWDDDIDVAMPRTDYEKLCSLYGKEFHEPYFLQTPVSDPGYYVSFAKLRNCNTAQISMPFKNAKFNQGIQIDIFPLDYCDVASSLDLRKAIKERVMKCSSFMKKGSEGKLNPRQLENFLNYQTKNPMGEFLEIQKMAMSCKSHDYVGISCLTTYEPTKMIWPTSCFENVEEREFENIKVALPVGWDKMLTICYGDYMQLPPVEQRGTWHNSCVLDFIHSYKEYISPQGEWLDEIKDNGAGN